MAWLDESQSARIAEAVRLAEAGTSGEIVCVFAEEASHYREVPMAWGIVAALAGPPLALAAGIGSLVSRLNPADWTVAHTAAIESQVALGLTVYGLSQVVVFLLVAALVAWPPVRRVLTPRSLRRRRAEQLARQQFAALDLTGPGVDVCAMIFVSRHDRVVQILAGPDLHAKAGQAAWDEAAAAVLAGMKSGDPAAGLEAAVRRVGQALAEHFPFDGEDPNRLGNRPVQI